MLDTWSIYRHSGRLDRVKIALQSRISQHGLLAGELGVTGEASGVCETEMGRMRGKHGPHGGLVRSGGDSRVCSRVWEDGGAPLLPSPGSGAVFSPLTPPLPNEQSPPTYFLPVKPAWGAACKMRGLAG